jgi:hypothetical protein
VSTNPFGTIYPASSLDAIRSVPGKNRSRKEPEAPAKPPRKGKKQPLKNPEIFLKNLLTFC